MPSRSNLVLLFALCAMLSPCVLAGFDMNDLLTQCFTANYSVTVSTNWCVFPVGYGVAGVLAPICQGVNNPLDAGSLVPSSLVPSGMVTPSSTEATAMAQLEPCNMGRGPGQVNESTARPCIEAFYQTGCQSVCRRYNPTGSLCNMDSAVFPAAACTDIEDKCAIFTNSSCLLSPGGDTFNLLKQTSCAGGQYTFNAQPNSQADGFPYVTADVDKIMAQLFPPIPSPTMAPASAPTVGTQQGDDATHTTLSLVLALVALLCLVA